MFIGQVVETGIIEPGEFPRVEPADEPVPSSTEAEAPILGPAAAR